VAQNEKEDERLIWYEAVKRKLIKKGMLELSEEEAREYSRMERLLTLRRLRALRKKHDG